VSFERDQELLTAAVSRDLTQAERDEMSVDALFTLVAKPGHVFSVRDRDRFSGDQLIVVHVVKGVELTESEKAKLNPQQLSQLVTLKQPGC
jgi:hypothetical protein